LLKREVIRRKEGKGYEIEGKIETESDSLKLNPVNADISLNKYFA
jgi:hypothetical protein